MEIREIQGEIARQESVDISPKRICVETDLGRLHSGIGRIQKTFPNQQFLSGIPADSAGLADQAATFEGAQSGVSPRSIMWRLFIQKIPGLVGLVNDHYSAFQL